MASKVEIKGLDALFQALQELPRRAAKNALRASVYAGAAVIRDEAKRQAPEYHGDVTKGHPPPGTLKRAIALRRVQSECTPTRETFYVYVRQAKNGSVGQKGIKAYGRLDAYYWRFVEFGTSKMAAHPFLRPAFEAKKQDALEAITAKLAARIEQEAIQLNTTGSQA